MSSSHTVRPTSWLSPQYINGVYIPSALLLVGTAIVKIEWLPFAAVLALALGGWKVYTNRGNLRSTLTLETKLTLRVEVKKVLKPTEFQEFPLKEKTILSHNTAM